MAKPGPKPKSTPLKLAAGTRKDRVNQSAPNRLEGEPEVPSYLDAEARNEWVRMASILSRLGLLSEALGPALGIYCQAFSRVVQAEKEIRLQGLVIELRNGFAANPYVRIARDGTRQMQAMLLEFGLTPSACYRVSVNAPAPPKDALEEFLKA